MIFSANVCPLPHWRPIVLVHGYLGSGDTYGKHAQRFSSNGHCLARIFAFDWNTLNQNLDSVPLLDAFVDDVLSVTGSTQIDLAGHSAGGGLGYEYLMDPDRAEKVAHYAHIGSFAYETAAGPEGGVPTLNLTSEGDLVVVTDGSIPGATNVRLQEEDHYSVATSNASFKAIYRHFHDGVDPEYVQILGEEKIEAYGKVLSFGENEAIDGATVEVYEVDPETGLHRTQEPLATVQSDEKGLWGPVPILAGTYYDFRAVDPAGGSVAPHYYLQPFLRTNPFVYLRTLPTGMSLVGLLLGSLPFDKEESVVVIFSNHQALVSGRDSLEIDGREILTDEIAPAEETTLALFLYDENANGKSDWSPVATFAELPFLTGIDSFFPVDTGEPIRLNLNGNSFSIPALAASTDGPVVVILDAP